MEQDDTSRLTKAKELVTQLQERLTSTADPASLSHKSKLPFKVMSHREPLLYRMTELAELACHLYEVKKLVSAFILTRSAMETAAMLFFLQKKIRAVVDSGDVAHVDQSLMKMLFGSKDNKGPLEGYNILTAIECVDKEMPHFSESYASLSEFAHPNWSGTKGAYAKYDKEKVWLDLGSDVGEIPPLIGLNPLIGSLEMFKLSYDWIGQLALQFIVICDKNIAQKSS